jgi:hypothetical protein
LTAGVSPMVTTTDRCVIVNAGREPCRWTEP